MAIIKAIAEGNKKLSSCLLLMFARFKLTKECETIKVWWVQSRREICHEGQARRFLWDRVIYLREAFIYVLAEFVR